MRQLVFFALVCGFLFAGYGESSPPAHKADRILVMKSAHTMTLMSNGQVIKIYKVALGDPRGPKVQVGDKKTPEGTYFVDAKNPHSLFHRALHLSYPNVADRERARKLGVHPGGDIEIHGLAANARRDSAVNGYSAHANRAVKCRRKGASYVNRIPRIFCRFFQTSRITSTR